MKNVGLQYINSFKRFNSLVGKGGDSVLEDSGVQFAFKVYQKI